MSKKTAEFEEALGTVYDEYSQYEEFPIDNRIFDSKLDENQIKMTFGEGYKRIKLPSNYLTIKANPSSIHIIRSSLIYTGDIIGMLSLSTDYVFTEKESKNIISTKFGYDASKVVLEKVLEKLKILKDGFVSEIITYTCLRLIALTELDLKLKNNAFGKKFSIRVEEFNDPRYGISFVLNAEVIFPSGETRQIYDNFDIIKLNGERVSAEKFQIYSKPTEADIDQIYLGIY